MEAEQGIISTDRKDDIELPNMPLQRILWQLFEIPDSSWVARIVALWSLFVIALSIGMCEYSLFNI